MYLHSLLRLCLEVFRGSQKELSYRIIDQGLSSPVDKPVPLPGYRENFRMEIHLS